MVHRPGKVAGRDPTGTAASAQPHVSDVFLRAGDRIRTGDVQLGKLAFYP
jgi:hypothetical protein